MRPSTATSALRHTGVVAHVRWTSTLQRVLVEDIRSNGSFMRVTLHEDARVFVVSHWQGDICVAATRIPVTAAPDLIELLVEALAHDGDEMTPPDQDVG